MGIRVLRKMFLLLIIALAIVSCSNDDAVKEPKLPKSPIVILYDNDVHCAVEGYAKLVAQRNLLAASTPYMSTVSCGDFVSGGIVGAVSHGEAIVTIMNEVGYDVVTLGNHELDYGMEQMFTLSDKLNAEVVCANLMNVQTQEHLYPAYHIISYDDVDIAYIGFTTTTSGTPKLLNDESGNRLYSFMRDEFYENAQHYIDMAREQGADYVVALSHLGDTPRSAEHPSSLDLIANTTGLDAVIDGHDHHVIEEKLVTNKAGQYVLLTSSGTAIENVGVLTLNQQGQFRSSLIDVSGDGAPTDEHIAKFVEQIQTQAEQSGDYVVGYSDVDLSIYDSQGERIVRKQETNIGNFIADAFRAFTSADVAMVNGGGIRTNIDKGDIKFNDIYAVMPFGDMIGTATLTGQQLLDVVEFSVSNLPNEAGVFMQVSGLKFSLNTSLPSPVVRDEADLFSHVGEGQRRVSDLQILDSTSGEYLPVDLSRKYTIASFDYLLLELGGSGIFRYAEPDDKYWGMAIEGVIEYLKNELGGRVGSQYADVDGRIKFLH